MVMRLVILGISVFALILSICSYIEAEKSLNQALETYEKVTGHPYKGAK